MIPFPTRTVLLTIQKHGVKALLMGGQACVLYGAAEVSRDTDLAVLVEPENLQALKAALDELNAESIAVPPFEADYLNRGFAVHFRSFHPDAMRQRIDIMSKMRGVATFEELWPRRAVLEDDEGNLFETLALPDLIQSKKTQRDKDWPMIRRLLEKDYRERRDNPTEFDIQFWLLELRTPELLIELARDFPTRQLSLTSARPLLQIATAEKQRELERELMVEELSERERDRQYWEPLKREIEKLRHSNI